MNAILFLIEAILAAHGDVIQNRKWCLARWQRARQEQPFHPALAPLADRADALGRSVPRVLGVPGDATELVETFAGLLTEASEALGIARCERGLLSMRASATCPFLPGADALLGADRRVHLGPADARYEERMATLEDTVALPAGDARAILAAVRGKIATLHAAA